MAERGTIKSMSVDLTDVACCAPLTGPVLSDEEASATARLFGALAEPARVRLVNLLVDAGQPVCVCELTGPLGLSQSTVSHHLKRLIDAGLLDREERGKWAYYSINAKAMARLASLVDLSAEGCR
jgi:ArsR family transcriptional regulator